MALKVLSPDIPNKFDVDGVRLNLVSAEAVRLSAEALIERAHRLRPDARIDGVVVQATVLRLKSRER